MISPLGHKESYDDGDDEKASDDDGDGACGLVTPNVQQDVRKKLNVNQNFQDSLCGGIRRFVCLHKIQSCNIQQLCRTSFIKQTHLRKVSMVNVNINALYTRWAYPKLPKAISFSFLQSVMINVYRLTASSPSTLPSLSDLRASQ